MTDARAMTQMLWRHYQRPNRPPAGVFAPEINSPCGRARADLIWMPTTLAGGKGLHGHEIKVARGDLLAEIADPTKADPWSRYCHRWWLVVSDPDLLDGVQIPDPWGVMAPPSGRRTRAMTVVKPAPKLTPSDPSPGYERLARWQLYRCHDQVRQLEQTNGYLERDVNRMRERLSTMEATGSSTPSPEAKAVARIVARVQERLRYERLWGFHLDDSADEELVVSAIVDQAATRSAAEAVRRDLDALLRKVEQIAEPFKFSARQVKQARDLAVRICGQSKSAQEGDQR